MQVDQHGGNCRCRLDALYCTLFFTKKNICLLGLCQTNIHDIFTDVDWPRKIGVGVIGVETVCARAIDMGAIDTGAIGMWLIGVGAIGASPPHHTLFLPSTREYSLLPHRAFQQF